MKKRKKIEIEPDEIFLDSANVSDFNTQQFEGRIEKPISKKTVFYSGIFFSIVFIFLLGRSFYVQVMQGHKFAERSEDNRLHSVPIFANRGVIQDRNSVPLAFNVFATTTDEVISTSTNEIPKRTYTSLAGFSHILGYVSYPKRDKSGVFWQDTYIGREGLEFQYDTFLSGKPGKKLVEVDAHLDVISENLAEYGEDGKTLTLSIDSRVQAELHRQIKALAGRAGFVGGAGVIMDIQTGEILALTSYPEYSSNTITNEPENPEVSAYFSRKDSPLLNRAIGIYTPGSTVKPYMAIAALTEGVIAPETRIISTGSITIKNRYGGRDTIFKDWKAHGPVNVREALAASSDVYFYEVGGGYGSQKGIGIDKIDEYMKKFKIDEITGIDLPGEKKGVIPTKEWKRENFPDDPEWNVGNTYHTSIGQFGFQISSLELVRAVASLANNGKLVTPHLTLDSASGKKYDSSLIEGVDTREIQIAREGMRQCVINKVHGTCKVLNVPGVSVAAKSGTAELGVSKQQVNSWISGFFPYEKPKYAFVIMMEKANVKNPYGATFVMKGLLEYMVKNTPEYVQ